MTNDNKYEAKSARHVSNKSTTSANSTRLRQAVWFHSDSSDDQASIKPCLSTASNEESNVTNENLQVKPRGSYLKAMVNGKSVTCKLTLDGKEVSQDDLKYLQADWDEVGKYNPVLVEVWKAWLRFVLVIDGKKTVDGLQVHLVPPHLPWLAPNQEDLKLVSLVMHYMPTKMANSVSHQLHPASAK